MAVSDNGGRHVARWTIVALAVYHAGTGVLLLMLDWVPMSISHFRFFAATGAPSMWGVVLVTSALICVGACTTQSPLVTAVGVGQQELILVMVLASAVVAAADGSRQDVLLVLSPLLNAALGGVAMARRVRHVLAVESWRSATSPSEMVH